MILVQNQIRNLLGRQTGKSTFMNLYIYMTWSKKTSQRYSILVPREVAHCKVVGIKVMTGFVARRDSVCFKLTVVTVLPLTPCKQKHFLQVSAHINWTAVYARSGMWCKAKVCWFWGHFLAGTLKRNMGR
jgi:hypothetical protein